MGGNSGKSRGVRLIVHAVAAYYTGGASLAASAAVESGVAQHENIKVQAKSEEFNARNREIDRKRNLIRALASQNVRGAASGIEGGIGSSQAALLTEDVDRYELDSATDAASTEQRTSQLRQNARNVTTSSLLSAASEGYEYKQRKDKRGTV